MAKLSIYLTFNGNAREAMNFYKLALGGELDVMDIKGSGMEDNMPEHLRNGVMHSALTFGEYMLLGSDMCDPYNFEAGTRYQVTLSCESDEEIERIFTALSEGGQVITPLRIEFWGGKFGQLIDKYGISWMFNYSEQPTEEK